MKQQIRIWADFVTRLIGGWYSQDDVAEIDVAFANRRTIAESERYLSGKEADLLSEADAELREKGLDAIKKAGMLDGYRLFGGDAPLEEWWWHL